MPIELTCTGCAQTLRVGDDHAGKRARCPTCGTISTIPLAGGSPAPAPTTPSPFDTSQRPIEPANPFADLPEPSPNPYQTPASPVGVPQSRYHKPERSGLILAFGILGIAICCVPLGIAAWVMGAADLKEIREGRMDPSGQGLTQAGMILGIVSSILTILWVLFCTFLTATRAL